MNTEDASMSLPPAVCSGEPGSLCDECGGRIGGSCDCGNSDRVRSEVYRWIERNHPDGFIDSQSYSSNLDRCREHAENSAETRQLKLNLAKCEQLEQCLREARRWIGDGDLSDDACYIGLYSSAYRDILRRMDELLKTNGSGHPPLAKTQTSVENHE